MSIRSAVTNDVLDQLFTDARSHHHWTDRAVSDESLKALYELAKWGPTSGNLQPARIVFVRSEEGKRKLYPALEGMGSNTDQVRMAPVTAIVAQDTRFFDQAPRLFPRMNFKPMFEADAAFAAMVEENEVRAELSHFERGRIAVIAAQQGAFANTEEAVNRLYATGSKAKRSKVRSFALIFEELGDMLEFPEDLTEKRGLRVSAALRLGAEAQLREALSGRPAKDSDEEWAALEPIIVGFESGPRDASRGGRPKSKPKELGWTNAKTLQLSSGITIRWAQDSRGHILRFEGRGIDSEIMKSLMTEIRNLLEKP